MPSKSSSGGRRHGPIRFANYQRIHNRRMQDFIQEGLVVSHTVRFGQPTSGYITLEGEINCLGGIMVEVKKKLQILSGQGPNAMVKTCEYSYNAYAIGRGNLFRYNSPHGYHRPYHHVHRYDILGTWDEIGDPEELRENEVPTLSEVLDEVRELYYGHEF